MEETPLNSWSCTGFDLCSEGGFHVKLNERVYTSLQLLLALAISEGPKFITCDFLFPGNAGFWKGGQNFEKGTIEQIRIVRCGDFPC